MKWFIHPAGRRLESWNRAIVKSYLPNTAVPAAEPVAAIIVDDVQVLPRIDNPPTHEVWQILTRGQYPVIEGGVATEQYSVTDRDVAAYKAERLEELKAIRFERETAGLIVNGFSVQTTRDSQNLIHGAANLAKEHLDDPDFRIDFIAIEGWEEIHAQQMVDIGVKVGEHIQRTFSRMRQLTEELYSPSVDTAQKVAAVDFTTGW